MAAHEKDWGPLDLMVCNCCHRVAFVLVGGLFCETPRNHPDFRPFSAKVMLLKSQNGLLMDTEWGKKLSWSAL
jgi:hypothetical protein